MFLWNMSLETGIASVDHGRKALLETMADFFQVIDLPNLNQKLVAERTGAIYTAMKAAFTAENEYLKSQAEDSSAHQGRHADFLRTYVDLCKKLVPKIKTLKQAQQSCLEVYRLIDTGVYHHITDEVLAYKHMHHKQLVKTA
jgi:hemerythrin